MMWKIFNESTKQENQTKISSRQPDSSLPWLMFHWSTFAKTSSYKSFVKQFLRTKFHTCFKFFFPESKHTNKNNIWSKFNVLWRMNFIFDNHWYYWTNVNNWVLWVKADDSKSRGCGFEPQCCIVDGMLIILVGAGATFDWTFFDNSNRRKWLRRV